MAQSKMRSLCDKAYVKVWSAKKITDTNYRCRVTISRKNDNKTEDYPDDYITDFSGYVTFRNDAARKISSLGLPEFIKKNDHTKPVDIQLAAAPSIRGGGFSRKELDEYKQIIGFCNDAKEGKVSPDDMDKVIKYVKARAGRYDFTIWDVELQNGSSTAQKTTSKKNIDIEDDDDDLPF